MNPVGGNSDSRLFYYNESCNLKRQETGTLQAIFRHCGKDA